MSHFGFEGRLLVLLLKGTHFILLLSKLCLTSQGLIISNKYVCSLSLLFNVFSGLKGTYF